MHWLIVRPMGDLVPRSGVRHSRHAGRRVPGTFEFEYLTRTAIAGQGRARWAPRCRYGFTGWPLREITQIASLPHMPWTTAVAGAIRRSAALRTARRCEWTLSLRVRVEDDYWQSPAA